MVNVTITIYLLKLKAYISLSFAFYTGESEPRNINDFASSEDRLVWAELFTSPGREARINSLPVNLITPGDVTTTYHYRASDAQFVGIAGDYANRTVFWSSTLNRTIYRGGLDDGSEATSLFTGTSTSVEGLAVDWMAKNVYWADSAYDWIMISDYNANYLRILIDTGLEKPRGIVTFPQRG